MSDTLVLCDFDGTITLQDTNHTIMNRYAGEAWIPVNLAWRRFEVSTETRVRQQYSLVRAPLDELVALVAREVGIDPGFPAFVEFCQTRAWGVHIVSDGFDRYIQRVLAKYDLGHLPFTSNKIFSRDGQIDFRFLQQDPCCPCGMCGNCKRFVVRQLRPPGGRIVFVGDGLSDRGAAEAADLVFAKGRLSDYCDREGIPFIEYKNFEDVQRELRARLLVL